MSYINASMPQSEKVEFDSSPSIQTGEEIGYGTTTELIEILAQENICEFLGDTKLREIAVDLTDKIAEDRNTMTPYLKRYGRAIKLAKMNPDKQAKNFPFENASNLVMPYILEAAIQFNARAMPALLATREICKVDINGRDNDGGKTKRGERVAEAINQDLRAGIKGWRQEIDKALLLLPIAGTYFKKIWQCPSENKRKSQLIYPDDLIFNHSASSFDFVSRKSFEYRMSKNEAISAIRTGDFVNLDIDYYKEDETIPFIESHCMLDLDNDGYAEPYIVNIEKEGGQQIVSIVPRFDEYDIKVNEDGEVAKINGEEFFTQTIFIPDPEGSCMGMGWGVILGDMFEAINTHMNQLTDAGTLSNIARNSGFYRQGLRTMGRANRTQKGVIDLKMGHFTAVESSGDGSLANSFYQPPFAGADTVLFSLLESLKNEVRTMTSATSAVEPSANEAAEMYLARLQESMRGTNAIMLRVFMGITQELNRIYEIMGKYLGQDAYMQMLDDEEANWAADFESDMNIVTTADPSQGSEQERIARAAIVKDISMNNPAFDARAANEDFLQALGVKDIERVLPPPQPQQPDPMQQIQAQALQTMSEAEKLNSEAKMLDSQAKMMSAQIDMMKVDAEIQKLEAETMKSLSEVDKNESETALKQMKEQREAFQQHFTILMDRVNEHSRKQAEDAKIRATQATEGRVLQDPLRSVRDGVRNNIS